LEYSTISKKSTLHIMVLFPRSSIQISNIWRAAVILCWFAV
jgi:hypothetical protein